MNSFYHNYAWLVKANSICLKKMSAVPKEVNIVNKLLWMDSAFSWQPCVQCQQSGGTGPLVNTSAFRELTVLTVLKRLMKSPFSTSDCCFTTSLVPVCTMFLLDVKPQYARFFQSRQWPYSWEGRVFWCSYCNRLWNVLQQSHPESESQARSLALPEALNFLIYSLILSYCVKIQAYPGLRWRSRVLHQWSISGPRLHTLLLGRFVVSSLCLLLCPANNKGWRCTLPGW